MVINTEILNSTLFRQYSLDYIAIIILCWIHSLSRLFKQLHVCFGKFTFIILYLIPAGVQPQNNINRMLFGVGITSGSC